MIGILIVLGLGVVYLLMRLALLRRDKQKLMKRLFSLENQVTSYQEKNRALLWEKGKALLEIKTLKELINEK